MSEPSLTCVRLARAVSNAGSRTGFLFSHAPGEAQRSVSSAGAGVSSCRAAGNGL